MTAPVLAKSAERLPVPISRSLSADAWRRLRRNRLALGGMCILLLIAFVGFSAPWWEANVTHFGRNEANSLLASQPPGVRGVSSTHPTYDGDPRAFALVDFDGDGFLTCRLIPAQNLVPPGLRFLESFAPSLHADVQRDLTALLHQAGDGDIGRALGVILGVIDCPELRLADEVATQHFEKLLGGDKPSENAQAGYLLWDEFPKSDDDLPSRFRGLGLTGLEAFTALDIDGDHVLSRWEIIERTRTLRYASQPDAGPRNFDRFVHDFDADGDLRVSLAEFPGAPELHTYVLGTDNNGRDILTRLFFGLRLSIMIGLLSTLVSLLIGVLYGAVAGYAGGRVDGLMMRFVDVLYGLPYIFLVILIIVIIDDRNNPVLLFMALGLVQWLTMARVVRGQVLSLKNREFIEAARAIGVSRTGIIFRHLIRNAVGPIIVYATLLVPAVILEEAFLSFLGLSIDLSLGNMIAEGRSTMENMPWQILFPSLALALILFGFNFFGDGVRDALDPQSKSR